MKLTIYRYYDDDDHTRGLLYVDGFFECYTVEDEYRAQKVSKETRIPNGTYDIQLRTVGGFHNRYSERFSDIHKGMLHLQDVPGFEYILIHVGNTDEDTAGCILTGATAGDNYVGQSVKAYKKLYLKVLHRLEKGDKVTIKITDHVEFC